MARVRGCSLLVGSLVVFDGDDDLLVPTMVLSVPRDLTACYPVGFSRVLTVAQLKTVPSTAPVLYLTTGRYCQKSGF